MTSALLAWILLVAQDTPEAALAGKCGSQIPWISDGIRLVDGTNKPPPDSSVDRMSLLERAKEQARERNRLVLWYCMRGPGSHMFRAANLDSYMSAAIFSDPGVVDLVQAKFVPLRMACDEKVITATGIKFPGFIEPGIILLTPDGRIVHVLDRIRTFNADWIRAALVAVLRKNPDLNAPAGGSVEELLRGGDDEKAWEKASPDQKALILRRAGRFREVLDLACSPLHKGIAQLGLREYDQARTLLEKENSAEALYHLSAVDAFSGRDPAPRWKTLVEKHSQSPWAWRAASNLVLGRDGLPDGPLAHRVEDFFLRPPEGAPTSTRLPARDVDSAAAAAVDYLLRIQQPDGTWSDARYSYGWAAYMIRRFKSEGRLDASYAVWPDPTLRPNYYTAVTALAATALLEWREIAPSRIDAALARAEKVLQDEGRVSPDRCEACYAEAYRLLFFATRKDVPRMNRTVARLAALQDRDGFWGHEYPSAFATAAVVRCLVLARDAGAEVPAPLLRRAGEALLITRGEGGKQDYRHEPGKPHSSERNSMGRTASSELALFACGRGSLENVAAGVASYWKHLGLLETIRTCDFHADEELAGFFYFNSTFHTLEAARALGEPQRSEHLRKFREQILAIPEWDGSFVDSHELGKSYGTAMGLLLLRRTR